MFEFMKWSFSVQASQRTNRKRLVQIHSVQPPKSQFPILGMTLPSTTPAKTCIMLTQFWICIVC